MQGLTWPLPESLDDAQLEHRLFPVPTPSGMRRQLPHWSEVHRELRRKGVTLSLLWQEYKATYPEGLQYSRFCEQYRAWASKLDVVMRQEHRDLSHTVPISVSMFQITPYPIADKHNTSLTKRSAGSPSVI